jgi:AcrR family transcriptional regulator
MNRKSSSRGRPINPRIQQERKTHLMDAAYALLQKKSYRSISIREIAAQADMQSAMISYYFGDKESLFIALLERLAEQQFAQFQKVSGETNPIKAFIPLAVHYFAKNSAITRLIADEILFQSSHLSDRFIDLFPKRLAAMLPELIIKQQQQGLCRTDINPTWAAFSLMTLILMPFIGASVRQTAWYITDQEVNSEAWSEHIYLLFTAGVMNQGGSS